MKKEELLELGLTEEQADKVFALNGKDINKVKSDLTSKEGELEKANQTIAELQDAVKKFDGVDVDGLKTSLTNLQERYDADISAAKLDNALNLALINAKVKNPKLVKGALDLADIKLDGDRLLGLDDQLKKLNQSDPYLFDSEEKTAAKVDSGHQHGSSLDDEGIDKFATAAMKGAMLKMTEKG